MDSSTFFKWFEEFEQKTRNFKEVCEFIWTLFSDKMTLQDFDKIPFSLVKKTSNIINDYPEKDTHIK